MILAVDIGGTHIRCAMVDTETIQLKNVKKWSRTSGAKVEPGKVVQIISEYMESSQCAELNVEAISIALAGSVDSEGRVVLLSENIGWYDVPLSNLIEQETGCPTVLETDVICGAIGEVRGNKELRDKIVAYVAVGTGIGHCITIGGKVLLGDTRSATRLGHLPIRHGGPKCYCGNYGCLCQFTAGTGLLERYKESMESSEQKTSVSTHDVIKDAQAGDKIAQAVLQEALQTFSQGLACVATVINPAVILLGGGVTSSGWPAVDQLTKFIKRNLTTDLLPRIQYGSFLTTANLIGAAYVGEGTIKNNRGELYL